MNEVNSKPERPSLAARATAKAAKLGITQIALSRAQAAASLGCNIQTIDSLIAAGTLKASKVNRRVFISATALQEMLDQHPAT